MIRYFRIASLIFTFALLGIVITSWVGFSGRAGNSNLPELGAVQPFVLTSSQNAEVRSDRLQNQVWIANFIFTTCSEQCPAIVASLQKLQKEFKSEPKLTLVSFTVDPKRDTPAVLASYAEKVSAVPEKWWFLTGDGKVLEDLFLKSFRVAGSPMAEESQGGMTHSSRLVLVDGKSQIRGYYDAMDRAAIEKLMADSKSLLAELN